MVPVAVWGAKRAECQRATDRDAVIKHQSGLLVLIGRGLTTQEGREVQASGVLSDTEEGEGRETFKIEKESGGREKAEVLLCPLSG